MKIMYFVTISQDGRIVQLLYPDKIKNIPTEDWIDEKIKKSKLTYKVKKIFVGDGE